jgi:hypothetical protein
MTSIYAYQKVSNEWTTIQMALPDNQGIDDDQRCTELCTLGGVTYVAVPDAAVLPDQPAEISASVANLTDALREQIKAASVHVSLIAERMVDKIRFKYTVDDELYFARIGLGGLMGLYEPTTSEQSAVQEFGAFVEGVRQWGRDERAKLGL